MRTHCTLTWDEVTFEFTLDTTGRPLPRMKESVDFVAATGQTISAAVTDIAYVYGSALSEDRTTIAMRIRHLPRAASVHDLARLLESLPAVSGVRTSFSDEGDE